MTVHDLPQALRVADRSAAERSVDGLLDAVRTADSTRVLVVHRDTAPLAAHDRLRLLHPRELRDLPVAEWAFLGREDGGAAILAAVLPADEDPPVLSETVGWGSLRIAGGDLLAPDAELLVEAVSLGRWLVEAPYCPACGARTAVADAGWSRRCPQCGRQHFPRTDPAVIVAVESADDGARLLLGSNALWGEDRYSCFAGFGEAGESLETTVAREVREECGVELAAVRYAGSQPWPYPRSLMVGFHARAQDDAAARADGEEILQVRWFTRDEIGAALAGESEVVLPGSSSIARRLIEEWHRASGGSPAS